MKKIKNNLIVLFIVSAFIITFSFAFPAHAVYFQQPAQSFMANSGASANIIPNSNTNNNNNNNNQTVYLTPVIDSISPTSASKCSGAKEINITGKNFIPSSVAKWNGSGRVTTYLNSTHLVMQANSTDICGLGNYLVTVDNGTANGGLSNGAYFTVKTAQVSGTTTSSSTQSVTPKPKATTPKATTPKTATAKADSCETDNDKNSLTANAIFGSDGFMPSNLFQWFLLFLMILLIVVLTRAIVAKKNKPLKHT